MTCQLFSPFDLGPLKLDNRILISPMCQYSAVDGNATDWHQIHLGSLALSGAGLLCLEATAVVPEGRITPACLGLWSDANEQAVARVIASLRRHSDMPLAIQLAHAGRKASSAPPWAGGQLLAANAGGWQTVAPSALPQLESEASPMALDIAGIERIRDAFVASARRAERLGFDAIQLHYAHGYLVHEFLSPLANRRDDRYGGSLENRMRFALETFDAVRAVWPKERALGVRISASDWVDGGWDLDGSIALARELKARGCDWIDCSSGGVSPQQKIALGPGYQVHFSDAIRAETGIATAAVGLITEPQQAEDIIANGAADMVALARAMLWNPHWPWHAAAALGAQVKAPPQYWRAPPREAKDVFVGASFGGR